MDITWGCDCSGCTAHDGSDLSVPCAFIVERDGREMKVCSRCDLRGDKYIARLFDGDSVPTTFFMYDPLGGFVLASLIDDEQWEQFKTRRNRQVMEKEE